MLRDLDYYADSAREAVYNDNDRDLIYQKIDDAANANFENPQELKALPWIQERKFVTTAPADALNAAIRTFAARMPRMEIQPLSDAPEEYERTEQHEELMKWEFTRMNMIGKKSPHWKIVEYAMKYCAVAIETAYLPFVYKDTEKTPRIKEILRSRNFRWNVHNPANIHVRESDEILESVVNCDVLTAQQLIDRYGEDNEGIRKMLDKVNSSDATALNTTYFTLYDYTDWDARVIWVADNGGMAYVNRDVPSGIEIMRKERTISFMPWIFVDNQEPILKQMVTAGLWDNVNILRTMQFSKAVDMAAHPEYWIQTPDGTLRGVTIDNTNPNQPLVTGPGVNVQKLVPPQIDPQLANLTMTAEQEVFRTTVAQILASVEKYAGTQNFSVVNAMLNAAIAQLSLAQLAAERAESLALIQNFRWIDETDIPMVGFRQYGKGEGKERGAEVKIEKGDFDPDYLYLSVKLEPATIMDMQTEINNAINKVERLGMSKKMAWDELGLENFDLSQSQTTEELLYTSQVQAKAKEIMMQPDLKAQMIQAQMQQQMQAQQQQGAEQTQFAGQQGMDTRGGGSPATQPGQGREQLNGTSASGQELA
jgi:hypothetical protein